MLRRLLLLSMALASACTALPSRVEDGAPAEPPYGYLVYCQHNPGDPLCRPLRK